MEARQSESSFVDNPMIQQGTVIAVRPESVNISENTSVTSDSNVKKDYIETILAWIDPTSGRKILKTLTFAQRNMLLSLKLSSGFIIVGNFALFIGSVFWAITEIYYVEAARTDKSHALLRQEGLGWVVTGCIGIGLGIFICLYVLRIVRAYIQNHPEELKKIVGSEFKEESESVRTLSVESGIYSERMNTEKLVEAIQLPVSPRVLDAIIFNYLHLFEDPKFVLPDEMKAILIRSAVFHKKPYQFTVVIIVQIIFCVSIGIFTYGHGSVGSGIVCACYIIYLLVSGAGKTVQYLKSLWRIASHDYLSTSVYKGDPLEIVFTTLGDDTDGAYGVMILAIGWQCFVIAQAYSVSGESPVLNFEHIIVTIVSLMVKVTSVCVALLAPDAATAAGTLVTFEFIAQFDDQFIELEAKYLKPNDFENVLPRPMFLEDFYAVLFEIIFIFSAGAAVTNAIVGLCF